MEKKWVVLISLCCGTSVVLAAAGPGKKHGVVTPSSAHISTVKPQEASADKPKASPASEAPKPAAVKPEVPSDGEQEAPKPKVFTKEEECRYCRTLGRMLRKQAGLEELGLSPECIKCVLEGVAEGGEVEEEAMREAMPYFRQKAEAQAKIREEEMKRTAAENKKKAEDFLKNLDKDPMVKKTDSGLRYKIVKAGEGEHPGLEHEVTIHYSGALIDGTVFDSSKGRDPASFLLGDVIPGFSEGVPLVAKGGVVKLWIPSDLGYGDHDLPKIPAGSLLCFEVELIDCKNAPKPKFDLEALQTALKESGSDKGASGKKEGKSESSSSLEFQESSSSDEEIFPNFSDSDEALEEL
ncbi:MAG: FKBP-type peptidyl-prolyl cis-trans isomerase [Puniceicoccales bacterium]|jgi:FKBP-type peptidyl-prolyl cis-trans isomerase|nr:FKBP-type peptidyl-prolyl cis-trans isomerase [Puniceicoccales bacterium]